MKKTILKERPVSKHPDDHYLKYVLAYLPDKEEYVTWLYNHSLDAYNLGHYFTDKEEAEQDFLTRG